MYSLRCDMGAWFDCWHTRSAGDGTAPRVVCGGRGTRTGGACSMHISRYGNNAGPWWRAARAMQSVIRISSPVQSGATQPVRIIVTCTRCVCIYKRVNPLKNSVIDHAVNTIFARHGNTKAIQRKTSKSCNALHLIGRPAMQTQAEAPLACTATGRLSICFGPLKPHQKVPEER